MRKLPFTASALALALMQIYTESPQADPWPPHYAAALNRLFPDVMPVAEWERRLRATGRQHHMYQDKTLGGVRNPKWADWYAADFVTRYEQEKPLYDQVSVKLLGENGNAFNVIGRVVSELGRNHVSQAAQDDFAAISMSGDYDNVLRTAMQWVTVQ